MTENWLPVPGYKELYEVSDKGRVRGLDRKVRRRDHLVTVKGCILSAKVLKGKQAGRRMVTLNKDGNPTSCFVAHLVLRAFVGKRPKGYHCCHNDGNKSNDCLKNLRYDTVAGNQADRYKHGTHQAGEHHHANKLTLQQALAIRKEYSKGNATYLSLAAKYKVSRGTIGDVLKGKTWPYDENGRLLRGEDRKKLYDPENVKTKRAARYRAFGKNLTLKEWSDATGLSHHVIYSRIRLGWCVKDAVTLPKGTRR